MTSGALYYPYIHIHDIEWLKGTLLLFDSVSRMLPCGVSEFVTERAHVSTQRCEL